MTIKASEPQDVLANCPLCEEEVELELELEPLLQCSKKGNILSLRCRVRTREHNCES